MKLLKKFAIFFLIVVVGTVVGGNYLVSKSKSKSEERLENNVEVGRPLRFVVMSDIHSDWENFRKALEKTKEGFRDFGDVGGFVIITGDLTTLGKKSELLEARKILDESGLKYYVIPGNHDIWMGRKVGQNIWGEVFGESFLSFKASEIQSFKDKEIKFILVNNGDGVAGVGGVREVGDVREIDWLKKEIEECIKIYCLVFMHMPLNHPNSLHVMGEEDPEVASEAAELIRLFVKNKVQEIIAGHLHFSSSYDLGGLKTTIVGAVGADRNFQSPKFLEARTRGDSLEKNDIFLDN